MTRPLIVIPLVGYVRLWLSAGALFLFYFRLFHLPIDPKNAVAMIRKAPAPLSMAIAAPSNFASFFATTQATPATIGASPSAATLAQIGGTSLACAIVLDMLITVVAEGIDVRVYSVNAMYLLAWSAIIPAVLPAGR